MKRLFLLLCALGLAAGLAWLARGVVDSTRFFEARGREATIVIGERYSNDRWARPVPLKKVYTYTALLEPKYEVLVETDQELKPNERVSIRFLTRDIVGELPASPMRPVVNSIRLRGVDDGAPVKVEETDLFDTWLDRAMGPPAEGVRVRPRVAREAPLAGGKPTVPFLIAAAGDTTFELLKKNSRPIEWLVFGFGVLSVISLLLSAWQRQKDALRPSTSDKDFVHPSLRRKDADPAAEPAKRISYVPRPDEEIVLPESEKRRLAAEAAQAAAAEGVFPAPPPVPQAAPPAVPAPSFPPPVPRPAAPVTASAPVPPPPAPAPATGPAAPGEAAKNKGPEELPSLFGNETAPPMPMNRNEPVLKLKRRG